MTPEGGNTVGGPAGCEVLDLGSYHQISANLSCLKGLQQHFVNLLPCCMEMLKNLQDALPEPGCKPVANFQHGIPCLHTFPLQLSNTIRLCVS